MREARFLAIATTAYHQKATQSRSADSLSRAAPLPVEVFFDLSCPFSLLGKVRLDSALRELKAAVAISWSPLILHPEVPADGLDFHAAHREKYGDRSRPLQLQVEQQAATLGLTIDHTRLKKVPNTIDAHRTVRYAGLEGRSGEMIDAILRGYLLEYRDIGDRNTLIELVRSLGLNAREFRKLLASDWQHAELLAAHRDSVSRGARSVPSYRFNGLYFGNTLDFIAALQRA